MLFNSYPFILVFLPAVFAAHHALRHAGYDRCAVAFLSSASLFFYGWWNPVYVFLIGGLILINYVAVRAVLAASSARTRRWGFAIGVGGNLCVLGYFKYSNFFLENANELFGLDFALQQVVLPLGISFFTFQKIALLADACEGKIKALNFLDYALFVLFFPQLIAGPIVHHSEVMPQFQARGRVPMGCVALGVTIFLIGLGKKVLLADGMAAYATPQFAAAASGAPLTCLQAWSGALAYTLQLYFDFSGYSDMAIGAALLFGIRLPLNFNSPYKARNIVEFWRRWHMTLSRFLRDYLYIPLGGNRKGGARRYINLFITMVLGGLWHGAGWTFVFWGALHGTYLAINHAWNGVCAHFKRSQNQGSGAGRLAGQGLTFLAVVIGWMFFRSDDMASALTMLKAMANFNDMLSGTTPMQIEDVGGDLLGAFTRIGLLLGLVWFAPNTQELVAYIPALRVSTVTRAQYIPPAQLQWRPSPSWAIFVGCLGATCLLSLSKISEFLYFQF